MHRKNASAFRPWMNCGCWQVNTGENLSVTPAEHRWQTRPRNVDTMFKTPAPLGAGSLHIIQQRFYIPTPFINTIPVKPTIIPSDSYKEHLILPPLQPAPDKAHAIGLEEELKEKEKYHVTSYVHRSRFIPPIQPTYKF